MSIHQSTETREERTARYERGDVELSPDTKIYSGEEAAQRGRALVEAAASTEEVAELDRVIRRGRRSER